MVKIKVDLEQREKLRRLHTATHIINYCAKQVLGNHIWQNGSNLKAEFGTLDITHYENLSQQEIFKIERLANKIVFENKKVSIEEIERTEAERKYGFTLYQGGAIPMKVLRVISIHNSDIEACGGIHMQSTGGIGLIKIIDTQKIQDGVVRLKFVVEEFALNFIEEKEKIVSQIRNIFLSDEKTLVKVVEKIYEENKELKKQTDKLKQELKDNYISQITISKDFEFELKSEYDMAFLMELFNTAIEKKSKFMLKSPKFIIATKEFKIKDFKKEIDKKQFSIFVL